MGPINNYLDYFRTLLAVTMLAYGSYRDIRTREIHDMVWIVFGGAGFLLASYELFVGSLTLRQLLTSLGFMVLLMILLGFLRLFGEADLLAFVTLSILHPQAPKYLSSTWIPPLFAFTLVSNTAIVGIFTPLLILAGNIIRISGGVNFFEYFNNVPAWRKTVLLFTGAYMEVDKIKGVPFHYPLETTQGELKLRPNIWDDEEAENVLRNLKTVKKRIWVSVTLPYIVVIFGGYILSIVFGDIILSLFILFM
jgi:hypothetical protein